MSAASRARVLFVAPVLPPVALAESIALLKRLRALADTLNLVVIAADTWGPGPTRLDRELQDWLPPGLPVIRVPWPTAAYWRPFDLAGQVLFTHSGVVNATELAWAARALRVLRRQGWLDTLDGLITNSSPVVSHLIGDRLTRRRPNLRWVQHYSDPFVDLTYRRYQPISRSVDRYFERRFLAKADLVTVTSAETRDLLVTRYQSRWPRVSDRISVVPHTYDRELFDAARVRYAAEQPFPQDGTIHAAYLGHFYGKRSIRPLCRWMDWRRHYAASSRKVRIHIFGSLRRAEQNLIERDYAGVIDLHDPVFYLRSLAVMTHSDALLVVDAPVAGASVHFPSKLADYLGAGRPIIAFTPRVGATARIVRETGHLAVPIEPEPGDWAQVEAVLSSGRLTASPSAYANDPRHVAPIVDALSRAATARRLQRV